MYNGIMFQRFHIRIEQHISNSLTRLIITGLNKPSKRSSAIAEHLLNGNGLLLHEGTLFLSVNLHARSLLHECTILLGHCFALAKL